MKSSPALEAVPHWITVGEQCDPEGSELERQWDECFEGMLSRRDVDSGSSKCVRQHRFDAMARGLKTAQWMSNGALAAAVKVGANRRMRLRCEEEDLMNELHYERQAAEELQTELSSEMRELRDRCHEQGQTVGLLTQRLADARSAIAAELQDAAAERAALGAELSEESQRHRLQAAMVHEEAEAASRVEAYEQQLASMLAVRDSLQAQLQAAVRVQTDLREHLDAERDGRAELEVAGERELVAWEKNKAMTHSPGTEVQSVRDAQRLQQHLNAEAVLCEREAAALRDRMEELEEEMQAAEESQQRCAVALGAAGCEWSLLHEEAEEAEQAASVKNAEIQRVTRQAREIQAQVHGVKEDILQCRQDHMALELKQERDFLHEEVQQEVNRQDDLYMELDEARRSRSLFQCLFPRKTSQPPLPPPSSAPPMRTRPQPLLRTAPTFQESSSGGMPSAPGIQSTAQRPPQGQGAGDSSSEEDDSDSEDICPQPKRNPAGSRPQADTDFIESDEV